MAHNGQQQTMPIRSRANTTSDEAIPDDDTSETTRLFVERLQAWKHACGYLEDYISASEKLQHAHAKEAEKLLKTVNQPLKEGEHFDQNLGGIAEMFDNIRTNTHAISQTHLEAARQIKSLVLPVFERLHNEIKHKNKELTKGAGKSSKAVDKARAATQKHMELLGQHSANADSAGAGKVDASNDPYVLQKGVYHRLHKQIQEENSTRNDLLTVQNNFAQFEAHIVQTFQLGMGSFSQAVCGQSDQQKILYSNIVQVSQNINPVFEWNGFVKRNNDLLIDPTAPARTLDTVGFPNQNHPSTQALMQGPLDRKSGLIKKWDTSFYAVTPARFLHQFSSDEMLAKDPSPDLTLYLPDCTVGGCTANTFTVRGKDVSSRLSTSKEFEFRARTSDEAQQWWNVIRHTAGAGAVTGSAPSSPVSPRNTKQFDAQQETGTALGGAYQERPNTQYGNGSPTAVRGVSGAYPDTQQYSSELPARSDLGGGLGGEPGSGMGAQSGLDGNPGHY